MDNPRFPEDWLSNFQRIVGEQGAKISQLTADNEELTYALSGVVQIIGDHFLKDIQPGDGPMDVVERLLEELHLLRNENELQTARIQGLEGELESLRTPK